MDEIEASLVSLALDANEREALVTADYVYALNDSVDQASAIVLGYNTSSSDRNDLDSVSNPRHRLILSLLVRMIRSFGQPMRILNVQVDFYGSYDIRLEVSPDSCLRLKDARFLIYEFNKLLKWQLSFVRLRCNGVTYISIRAVLPIDGLLKHK